jgi:aquaporin Z
MIDTLRHGWSHLLIEAGGAALLLFAACVYATLLHHPASPIAAMIPSPAAQRALMGLAMGTTVAAFTYSRLGRRSGAHLNPAVTLTFLRLGRVRRRAGRRRCHWDNDRVSRPARVVGPS